VTGKANTGRNKIKIKHRKRPGFRRKNRQIAQKEEKEAEWRIKKRI
jgi:hypothetical protein